MVEHRTLLQGDFVTGARPAEGKVIIAGGNERQTRAQFLPVDRLPDFKGATFIQALRKSL
jgi:hypothetical protein